MMQIEKEVILLLGSNVNRHKNLIAAMGALQPSLFSGWSCSELLRTSPVGLDGPDFMNALVKGKTSLSYDDFLKLTKDIERQLGRRPGDKAKGRVIIDIDILLFDGIRYHEKDWGREYVKRLMEK